MTQGEWMFYAGIAGFAASLVSLIVVKLLLASRKRKLEKMLDREYNA